MRAPSIAVITVALLITVSASGASAQTVHLRPIFRRDIPPTEAVLRIVRADTATALANTSWFYIEGDNLLISTGRTVDRILLSNRTLSDVVNELRSKYGVNATTPYPAHSAAVLGLTEKPQTFTQGVLALTAAPSSPTAHLGFGLVLGLNGDDSESGGILSQTGFQLDVAGVHQWRSSSPGTTSKRAALFKKAQVFTQVRLGLSSDQQLVAKEDSLGAPPVGIQFESAVRQADQISLTGQFDLVWPVQKRTDFGVSLGYGLNWTQPEAFVFPSISVRDSLRAPEQIFGADRVARITDALNSATALSEFSVIGSFRFHSGRELAYYAGGGLLNREVLKRGFSFRRSANQQPDSTSLRPLLEGRGAWFWQAVFGINVPGVVEVRLDGVGPMEREFDRPVLRLILARNFPVKD